MNTIQELKVFIEIQYFYTCAQELILICSVTGTKMGTPRIRDRPMYVYVSHTNKDGRKANIIFTEYEYFMFLCNGINYLTM